MAKFNSDVTHQARLKIAKDSAGRSMSWGDIEKTACASPSRVVSHAFHVYHLIVAAPRQK